MSGAEMPEPTRAELEMEIAEARELWRFTLADPYPEQIDAYGAAERKLGRLEGREERRRVSGCHHEFCDKDSCHWCGVNAPVEEAGRA